MGLDREALGLAFCFIDRYGERSRPVLDRMILQCFEDGMIATTAYLTMVELAIILIEEPAGRPEELN